MKRFKETYLAIKTEGMKWLCMKCLRNKDNHCKIHFYFMLTDYGVKSFFFYKNWIRYESCTSRITLKARSWLLLKLTSISSRSTVIDLDLWEVTSRKIAFLFVAMLTRAASRRLHLWYIYQSYLNLILIILTLLVLAPRIFFSLLVFSYLSIKLYSWNIVFVVYLVACWFPSFGEIV